MNRACDHTSVGMLVWRHRRLLLIERRKPPFGFAPPAGHVDDHGSFETAAKIELKEEAGLDAKHVELLIEGRRENTCRRKNGTWHHWRIYRVIEEGRLRRSRSETKRIGWYSEEDLRKLISRTHRYLRNEINETQWRRSPGLEPVWCEWFDELGLLEHSSNYPPRSNLGGC